MACGTSTNGANHSDVGGSAATGDGDLMMCFLPSFAAVNMMELGLSSSESCNRASTPILKKFPSFFWWNFCVNKNGQYAGAGDNMDFAFSIF